MLVITECFCKESRFPKNISRLILTGAFAVFVICLTFFTDLGALKMFAVLSVIIALIKLCYQISFHESLIIMEMSFTIMNILPEAVSTALMSFIYNGDITNTIGDVVILKWELYVFPFCFASYVLQPHIICFAISVIVCSERILWFCLWVSCWRFPFHLPVHTVI